MLDVHRPAVCRSRLSGVIEVLRKDVQFSPPEHFVVVAKV